MNQLTQFSETPAREQIQPRKSSQVGHLRSDATARPHADGKNRSALAAVIPPGALLNRNPQLFLR